MGEGDEPGEEECGDGHHEGNEEEEFVAESLANPSADHAGEHDAEVHDCGGKGVVGHGVLAGCNLLHHEHCEANEAEAVAEVFEHESCANNEHALGLEG